MNENKIALYLDLYLEKDNVLSVTSPEAKKRLSQYICFCEKVCVNGYLFRRNGENILDDVEVEVDNATWVLPAGRLLNALEYIPDLSEDMP